MVIKEPDHKTSQTREMLIKSGVSMIAQKGYIGASIDDIVRQAGVSKGAFYHHFRSKENFVISILKERTEENLNRFHDQIEKDISLSDWIERSFSTIISFPGDDSSWSIFSLEIMIAGMHVGEEKLADLSVWIHEAWREMLIEMICISKEYRQGEIACDADVLVVGIMAMIDGLIIHSSIERETFSEQEFIRRLAPMMKYWIVQSHSY